MTQLFIAVIGYLVQIIHVKQCRYSGGIFQNVQNFEFSVNQTISFTKTYPMKEYLMAA